MTKVDMYNRIVVSKGNHYCMFCDQIADFVITDHSVSPKKEYPMCSECAAVFKQRIDSGLSQLRTKHYFITNAEKRRYECMKEKRIVRGEYNE